MTYFTDIVKIIAVTQDDNGVVTETPGAEIKARVMLKTRMITNINGQEIIGVASIQVHKNTVVKYGYKVQVVRVRGVDYPLSDKDFIIHLIKPVGGFVVELTKIEI